MGYFSSSQTTTVKTAPLSQHGEELNSLLMDIIMQNLQEYGGYDVSTVEKTKYADQGKADQLKSQISDIDVKIAAIQDKNKASISGVGEGNRKDTGAGFGANNAQLAALEKQKANLQNQLNKIPVTTYQDYDLKKKEDPLVQATIAKFGPDAPEVQAAREKVKSNELEKLNLENEINSSFIKNLQKFASGDMSYTDAQAKQVDTYIAPVKDLILSTTNDLLNQFGQSDLALRDSLSQLSLEVDKSGFAIEDALEAASVQFEKSGANLMDTLQKVNKSSEARAKFQFDLLSKQADTQAAQQAALLGLPPGSMAEKAAATKMKTDALTQIQLDLNEREAQGALSIQGGVESGKQQISLAKIQLAESQGAKKEGIAKTGLDLTQALTGKIESAIGNKGNALLNLEQQKQNMLLNAGYGGLPDQLQATSQGLAFMQNKDLQGLNIQSMLMNPIVQQLAFEQQKALTEQTTTTKKSPSIVDSVTGLFGAAASAAGAVTDLSGIGTGVKDATKAAGGVLSGMSGGGGGFTGLNLSTYKPTPSYNLGNYSSGLTLG